MRPVVLFASAVALLAAACGGSSEPKAANSPKTSTTSASTPPPSDPTAKPRAPITELKRADVKTAIQRMNTGKQTRINTIIFVPGDGDEEGSASFRELMKEIAKDNGGVFAHVKESELH